MTTEYTPETDIFHTLVDVPDDSDPPAAGLGTTAHEAALDNCMFLYMQRSSHRLVNRGTFADDGLTTIAANSTSSYSESYDVSTSIGLVQIGDIVEVDVAFQGPGTTTGGYFRVIHTVSGRSPTLFPGTEIITTTGTNIHWCLVSEATMTEAGTCRIRLQPKTDGGGGEQRVVGPLMIRWKIWRANDDGI